jgi:hypothetical protein
MITINRESISTTKKERAKGKWVEARLRKARREKQARREKEMRLKAPSRV